MLIYLKKTDWTKLFNVYMNKKWQTDKSDKRINHIYYTLDNDVYKTIDVLGEVYVEEFNNVQDMQEFYRERVHEQVTIFDC